MNPVGLKQTLNRQQFIRAVGSCMRRIGANEADIACLYDEIDASYNDEAVPEQVAEAVWGRVKAAMLGGGGQAP